MITHFQSDSDQQTRHDTSTECVIMLVYCMQMLALNTIGTMCYNVSLLYAKVGIEHHWDNVSYS